jgi:hypothetical protein
MQPVLYALSDVFVVVVVIVSLVGIRRSQQGRDLDLEVAAAGWLDDRFALRSASSPSSRSMAA